MANQVKKGNRREVIAKARKKEPEFSDEEEQILRKATLHLIHKLGGLLVATDIREESGSSSRTWVITVTLRYPTGHEGYVGDLLYDGTDFTLLTPLEVLRQRARSIATNPEGIRKWHEYRPSTLATGEA